jgi:hypothetical protein
MYDLKDRYLSTQRQAEKASTEGSPTNEDEICVISKVTHESSLLATLTPCHVYCLSEKYGRLHHPLEVSS